MKSLTKLIPYVGIAFYGLLLLLLTSNLSYVLFTDFNATDFSWTSASSLNVLDILLSQYIPLSVSLLIALFAWKKQLKQADRSQVKRLFLVILGQVVIYPALIVYSANSRFTSETLLELGLVLIIALGSVITAAISFNKKATLILVAIILASLGFWLVFGRSYVWDGQHTQQYFGPLYPRKTYIAG